MLVRVRRLTYLAGENLPPAEDELWLARIADGFFPSFSVALRQLLQRLLGFGPPNGVGRMM